MKRFLFLFLLLCCQNVLIGETLERFDFYGFKGGLNLKEEPNIIGNDQSKARLNILSDEKGGVVTADKLLCVYSLPVSTDTEFLGGIAPDYDDGTSEFVVQVGSEIYRLTGNDKWVRIIGDVSTLFPMNYVVFRGKLWMTNPIDGVSSWDKNTETYTTYSFIPKGWFIEADKEQLLIAGMLDNPSSVRFTRLTDDDGDLANGEIAADWPTTHEKYIEKGSGEITGIFRFKNKIYVTKTNSFHGILTSADYLDSIVINYEVNYGCISKNSIANYESNKIMLDGINKKLVEFNGNAAREISDDVDPIIEEIGLLTSSLVKITQTTNTDFSTGSYSNCWNNNGTVEISTIGKNWQATADFAGGTETNVTTINDEIKLSTSVGGIETPIDITSGDMSANYILWDNDPSNYGKYYQKANIYDGNIDTYWKGRFYSVGGNWYRSYFSDVIPTTFYKIKIKHWLQWWEQYIPNLPLGTKQAFTSNQIRVWNSEGGWYTLGNLSATTTSTPVIETIYVPSVYKTSPYNSITKIEWVLNEDNYSASNVHHLIYEIEAYAYSTDYIAYNPNGTYISPVFDTTVTNPKYKKLDFSPSLTDGLSTGTIAMSVCSSADSNILNATAWYPLGISSATNDAIDDKRYFWWKADMVTSSVTFTPILYDVDLEYATSGTGIYASKVLAISNKINEWFSFLATTDGNVTFRIRGATYTFPLDDTNIGWDSIISGATIELSTSVAYIQYEATLTTKASKLKSVTISYKKGSGYIQDIAGGNFQKRYFLSYSTMSGHNTHTLVFDGNRKFTLLDWDAVSFVNFDNNFYILSSTAPVILQAFTGLDNTNPAYITSPFTDLGFPNYDKELRFIYLTYAPKADSYCWFDYSVDNSTITHTAFCDLSKHRNKRIPLTDGVIGKNFYFTPKTTSTYNLQGYSVLFEKKPLR